MPGGYIPTLETKQRECWKTRHSRLNSRFDSMVYVQPYREEPLEPEDQREDMKVVNLTGRDRNKRIVEVTVGMAPGEEREFEDIYRVLTYHSVDICFSLLRPPQPVALFGFHCATIS